YRSRYTQGRSNVLYWYRIIHKMKKLLIIFAVLIFLTGCKSSKDSSEYLLRGQQYLANMEYSKALNEFEQGRANYPQDPNYYLAIAEINLKKGNREIALSTLYDGYNASSSVDISNAIGEILIKQG